VAGSSEPWVVPAEGDAGALAAFVRARTGEPWARVKKWIADGKVFVDGERAVDPGRRLRPGQAVELRMAAPRPRDAGAEVRIVFEDPHVVVIDKPAGVSSVPYVERRPDVRIPHVETGTALDLVRDAWRRMGRPATSTPLHVVHRIDKETSGLLAFAKSKRAEQALAAQFRAHTIDRTYVCVAHGDVRAATIESQLVGDRGDGLRGSTRRPAQGKRAVTHVKPLRRLAGATLCEVRLETGKTHQIRIHLAERGHPLVGEKVYVRDWRRDGHAELPSPRLLLHAATLGFAHPITGERIGLEAPLPDDFRAALASLE
jgi:23S rRNA pseudouridine1911/1915/1917 synthase